MTVETVPNQSPRHLRIHVEETDPGDESQRDTPIWDRLRSAYLGLTGWQLDVTSDAVPLGASTITEIPHPTGDSVSKIYRRKSTDIQAKEEVKEHAQQMAETIGELMRELQLNRQAIAERECEIASLQPYRVRLDELNEFHHRMQSVLRGAVEVMRGRAAAFYMLDDETTVLKLRLHWGLSSLRFLEPSRPLRGAVADLEALTGHAVVLEDTSLFQHWNVPEAFSSAICVPVSSSDTLLGTLWFFADDVRDYSDAETQLLEIIAGRLAIEFEHRSLTAEVMDQRNRRDERISRPKAVKQEPPLIEGWDVAAEIVPNGKTLTDLHLWHLGVDNRLGLCSASIAGSESEELDAPSLLRGAVRGLLASDLSLAERLRATNEVMWAGSSDVGGASMFLGSLSPKTGELQYATAGYSDAYILRPHGWEPISLDSPAIGDDADWDGYTDVQELHEGDVLLVFSDRSLDSVNPEPEFDTTSIAETLLRHVHLSAQELVELATERITERCSDPAGRSVLVVKRRD